VRDAHQIERPLERAQVLEDSLVVAGQLQVAVLVADRGSIVRGDDFVVEGGRRLPNELLPGLAVALDAERPLVVHRRVRDEVLDFAAVHLEEDPLVSNLDDVEFSENC